MGPECAEDVYPVQSRCATTYSRGLGYRLEFRSLFVTEAKGLNQERDRMVVRSASQTAF